MDYPSWQIRQAARQIRQGGIVAYPTEAVYGLGCDPTNAVAVQRILQLKGRPKAKGLILIAADFQQLHPFLGDLSSLNLTPAFSSWPGPQTWLLPAAKNTPAWLCGQHATLAVRVTAHPLAAALCRCCHLPLVSTSANPSGRPPVRTALGVRRYFDDQLDQILAGTVGRSSRPTPIRDLQTGNLIRA